MSEEEKKAIERLRITENKIDGLCEDIIESRNIAIETVLNLITKLQKENEELRKGQNSLMQSRKKWKDRYYKLKKKNKKIIDEMGRNISNITDYLLKIFEIDLNYENRYGNGVIKMEKEEINNIKENYNKLLKKYNKKVQENKDLKELIYKLGIKAIKEVIK